MRLSAGFLFSPPPAQKSFCLSGSEKHEAGSLRYTRLTLPDFFLCLVILTSPRRCGEALSYLLDATRKPKNSYLRSRDTIVVDVFGARLFTTLLHASFLLLTKCHDCSPALLPVHR